MDDAVRALERRWRESGADEDAASWLLARSRDAAGLEDVRVAAALGHVPAIVALGEGAPAPIAIDAAGRSAFEALRALSGRWAAVAVLLVALNHDPDLEEVLAPWRAWLLAGAHGAPPPRSARVERLLAAVNAALVGDPVARLAATALQVYELVPQGERLRDQLLAAILGAPPRASSVERALERLAVHLVPTDDDLRQLLGTTATWLNGLQPWPGRVRVVVARPTVPLRKTVAATWEALAWEPVPSPRAQGGTVRSFIAIVTRKPDADGWFARHHPELPKVSVVHLDYVTRLRLEAPLEATLAHLLAKKVLDGLMAEGLLRHDYERVTRPLLHGPPRGCAFDLCRDKVSLDARIRAGAVCRDCDELLRDNARVPAATLAAVVRILEAARDRFSAEA